MARAFICFSLVEIIIIHDSIHSLAVGMHPSVDLIHVCFIERVDNAKVLKIAENVCGKLQCKCSAIDAIECEVEMITETRPRSVTLQVWCELFTQCAFVCIGVWVGVECVEHCIQHNEDKRWISPP